MVLFAEEKVEKGNGNGNGKKSGPRTATRQEEWP
jgi:hypothetical protein